MSYQLLQSFFTVKKLIQIVFYLILISLGHFIAFKIVHIPAQFEMVVLFAVFSFYPIIRYPQIGLILLFSIAPFIPFFRRLYYLQYARPGADPLIMLGDLIIVFIIIGLFFEFRERKQNTEHGTRMVQIVLVYFAYLIFRTFIFTIVSPADAIQKFRFYGPAVLMFTIGTVVAYNSKLINQILTITLGVGIIAALYGLKQLYFGYSEAEKIWFSSISFSTLFIKGLARPFSLFQSPAAFADYMQISLIAVIIFVLSKKKSVMSVVMIACIPLFFYGSLITSVRSNWIGIIVSIVLWIIFKQFKKNKSRLISLAVIGIMFAISQTLEFNPADGISSLVKITSHSSESQQLNQLVAERTDALLNPFEEHSFLSRLMLWKLIIDVSLEPYMGLIGRGLGALNADSLYFTYLAEFGYPGILFILSLTIVIITRGLSLVDKSEGFVHSFAIGVTIFNITLAIINITGTHIHSFPGDVYFWFFNGILLKLEAVARKSDTPISYENITYH